MPHWACPKAQVAFLPDTTALLGWLLDSSKQLIMAICLLKSPHNAVPLKWVIYIIKVCAS